MVTHDHRRKAAGRPGGGRAAPRGALAADHAGRARVSQVLRSARVQTKLTVGPPGDSYEREADRVADAVMRMPDAEREEERVHRHPAGDGDVPEVTPEVESGVRGLHGGGEPLPESARSFFEPRFGRDLGDVRVHTSPRAAETAYALSAQAYTVGSDIAFAQGAYQPDSASGRRLIAHELAHVEQQRDVAARTPAIQRKALPETINGVTMTKAPSVVDANLRDVATDVLEKVITTPLGGVVLDALWVSSVNDGGHSTNSRHFANLAVDISRMKTEGAANWQYMASDYPSNENVKKVVVALQDGFEAEVGTPGVRENFGPYLKKKNGANWRVGGHGDHIHVSFNA